MKIATLITQARHKWPCVRTRSLALCVLMIAMARATSLLAASEAPPYSTIISPDMYTNEIQQAIENGSGAVYFKPGVYYLTGPLPLIGSRAYIGAGSSDRRFGSILVQTSTQSGTPIFCLDHYVESVTIKGLVFDGAPGVNARAIGTADPNSCSRKDQSTPALLLTSTIKDNYFLTGLAEGIDTPMEVVVIEGNHFGIDSLYSSPTGNIRHRHIHCVYPDLENQSSENWSTAVRILHNTFANAKGSESVFFESGVQLQFIGNDFDDNDADSTLQINGMLQVVLDGNRFERNNGKYIMRFARSRHRKSLDDGTITNGNEIVRLQHNFYDMQLNDYIFTIDSNSDDNIRSGTHVFMGDESGRHFAPNTDRGPADLTDKEIAFTCNKDTNAEIYLSIVGPFNIRDYAAKNQNCCGPTETTPCK